MSKPQPTVKRAKDSAAWFAEGEDANGKVLVARGDSQEHAREVWHWEYENSAIDGPEPAKIAMDGTRLVVFTRGRHAIWISPSPADETRLRGAVEGGAPLDTLVRLVPGGEIVREPHEKAR
jgi:hypothetical protein